jgi:hypothetical protein
MPRDLTVMLCAVPQAHQVFVVIVIQTRAQVIKQRWIETVDRFVPKTD